MEECKLIISDTHGSDIDVPYMECCLSTFCAGPWVSLVPRLSHSRTKISVLLATKSWAGPENEASLGSCLQVCVFAGEVHHSMRSDQSYVIIKST